MDIRGYPFLDHPAPLAFAHRGGMAHAPQNSMAAFERAVRLGYRYLETDVQATADGVLIAFHDATLEPITDRNGVIARLPYRQVAAARIDGIEPIPRLEDILGTWPQVRVNIDVKDPAAIAPLAAALARTNAFDRVCLASFSARRLARMRAALPADKQVCTSLTPLRVLGMRLAAHAGPARARLARLAGAGVPCLQVPPATGALPLITRAFVTTAHALGMQVHAWTINDPTEIARLLDLGVDGIMSDDLFALRDVLHARGLWHGGGLEERGNSPPAFTS